MNKHDAHFLRLALECASESKDPNTQVGAVIVGAEREPLSTGYNGFPRGVHDRPDRLNDRDVKNKLMVHAEMNAILNCARIGTSTKGCTLYLVATDDSDDVWGGPPCVACTLGVIQAGIKMVVAPPFKSGESKWRASTEEARLLLTEAGVGLREVEFVSSGRNVRKPRQTM